MTNDREMPCDIDEFFLGLRELLDACAGTSRHDQAIVGIHYCIDKGWDTGSQIIGSMKRMGFNGRHIGAVLHAFSGSNPARHYWLRGEDGRYRNLPDT